MTLKTKVLKKMVKQNIVVRMIFHRTRNTLWWYGYRLDFTASKVSKEVVFSGPYFPLFGLNTEIDSVFGHFSRSAFDLHEVKGWEGQICCNCVADYTLYMTPIKNSQKRWSHFLSSYQSSVRKSFEEENKSLMNGRKIPLRTMFYPVMLWSWNFADC